MYHKNAFLLAVTSLSCVLLCSSINSNVAVGQGFNSEDFQNTILSEHNARRSTHQAPPLVLDNNLSQSAQAHAEQLSQTGNLKHSGSSFGENLYYSKAVARTFINGQDTADGQFVLKQYPGYITEKLEPLGKPATNAWYSEVSNYNYDTGTSINNKPIGHFTQVVWQATTKMGCGAAVKETEKTTKFGSVTILVQEREGYVVCQYSPPGNFFGLYKENVLKP